MFTDRCALVWKGFIGPYATDWTCNSILESIFRQPSGRGKNEIPVEREFGNLGLNVSAADCTAAADRQISIYLKVANRPADRVGKSAWLTNSLLNVLNRIAEAKALRYGIVPAVALTTHWTCNKTLV